MAVRRRLALIAAVGIWASAAATTADATTITGGGPFTANAGASRLVVDGGGPPVALNCSTTGMSGSFTSGVFGTPPPDVTVGQAIPTFASCVGPSSLAWLRVCNTTTPARLDVSGPTVAGVTPGTIAGIDCTTTFPALGCSAKIMGSVPVRYANPGIASLNGVLTVLVAGQALAVSGSTCPASFAPNGPAFLGAPAGTGAGLANLPYTLTTTGPTIS